MFDHQAAGAAIGAGHIIGVVGVSRDLRAPGDRDIIPARLAATLEYLETRYADAVSPALLARHAGLPSVRFARLIKRIFRLTPHQLITQTRLAAASHLLRETDRSVAEIALTADSTTTRRSLAPSAPRLT